jgi:F0F1-type ATP synthase assembly protein I
MQQQTVRVPRWVIGIIIGFAVVVLVNAVFIYIAVRGAEPIAPSYTAEER